MGCKALRNFSRKEENLTAILREERHRAAPSHPPREHIPLHPLPSQPTPCPCALLATPDTPRVSKTSYVFLRAGSQGLQGAALSAHDMPVCSACHTRPQHLQRNPLNLASLVPTCTPVIKIWIPYINYQHGRHACTHTLCTAETETFALSDFNFERHRRHPFSFSLSLSHSRFLVLPLSNITAYLAAQTPFHPPHGNSESCKF